MPEFNRILDTPTQLTSSKTDIRVLHFSMKRLKLYKTTLLLAIIIKDKVNCSNIIMHMILPNIAGKADSGEKKMPCVAIMKIFNYSA